MMKDETKRNSLLQSGGFGENISTQDPIDGPPMDERTVCIGDVVGIRKPGQHISVKVKVTGPRAPCYKLNHRFGVPNMSQRTQNKCRTGWMYRILVEGNVEIGDEMILLERTHPEWPVARVQHYLYSDAKNLEMINELLTTLQSNLVWDVRETLENRLTRGVEDWEGRLKGINRNTPKEKFVQYRLRNRRTETERISEFVFERVKKVDECSSDFTVATPGSHVRLKFKLPDRDNMEMIRPYSIVCGDSNEFRLGIALSDKSRGGSSYLHATLKVGDVIEASDKFANTFPLASEEVADNHVFLAGGIGITAFLDHIQHCINNKKPFHLHYLVRNASDVAFSSEIQNMLAQARALNSTCKEHNDQSSKANGVNDFHTDQKSPFLVSIYNSASGNRCNVQTLLASIATQKNTHVYICGSERLSDSVIAHARELDISGKRLHFEQFSVDASGDPFIAELTRSKLKLNVAGEQTLLEALRGAGLAIESSCEAGNCGTCRVRVRCGKVIHRGSGLLDDEKAEDGQEGDMLSCVSRGIGTIQIEL